MSGAQLVEDLRASGLALLSDVTSIIMADMNATDLAIVRIESLIEAISSVNSYVEFSWSQNATQLLLKIIQELEHVADSVEHRSEVGRPKIHIPIHAIENLMELNFNVPRIASMLGVSRDTIFRRMKENGLSIRDTYTTITDDEFHRVVLQILLDFPSTGYKRMKGFLLNRGIKVTEHRVRDALKILDPVGVYQRTTQNRAIFRRQYFVEYSNQLWHLDTNMKLIRWSIVVRSCIDGKSRTVVYLSASADNRADTNLQSFVSAVRMYGVPLRTRSDKGGENVQIAKYMIESRGTGRASHICGRSVHNQRIERFWRDVFYGCLSSYYALFSRLEDDGYLNLDDSRHLYVLHRIFMPRLNANLETFMDSWNRHPISTEGNLSPRQLMALHLPPSTFDLEFRMDVNPGVDFVCDDNIDLEQFSREDTIINPQTVGVSLTAEEYRYLDSIDVLQESDSFGYNIFADAINFLHWTPND